MENFKKAASVFFSILLVAPHEIPVDPTELGARSPFT